MDTKVRVLVVEDELLIAHDISGSLERRGYEVCGVVDTGEEAITKVRETSPDIILMDIHLKGKIDGIEATSAISAEADIPVIFLTAYSDEGTLQRAKLTRPFGFLIKPFDPNELHSMIEVTLERARKLSQETPASLAPEASPEMEFNAAISESDVANRAAFLSRLPLFEGVSSRTIEHFATQISLRQFESGEHFILEGDAPNGGFIVVSGRISVMKSSPAGKELIVALLAPGDTFGLLYTTKHFAKSSSARCQVASRVFWIAVKAFEGILAESPTLARNFNETIAERLSLSHTLSTSIAHTRVEDRIISTLVILFTQFGKGNGKLNEGHIYMTRKELSDLVGTTPETAIRITKALEREGLLSLTRPGVIKILDLKRLGQAEKNLYNA